MARGLLGASAATSTSHAMGLSGGGTWECSPSWTILFGVRADMQLLCTTTTVVRANVYGVAVAGTIVRRR
jgi:hypothetical protein